MSQKMYVRLKPYNPRRGHVLRRYSIRNMRFYEGRWFRVSEAVARELANIKQVYGDEDSPDAFDVATHAQANNIERKEKAREEVERRKVDNAEVIGAIDIDDKRVRALTTDDLPKENESQDEEPLGVSMASSKEDLIDTAQSLGLDVTPRMRKRTVYNKIVEEIDRSP